MALSDQKVRVWGTIAAVIIMKRLYHVILPVYSLLRAMALDYLLIKKSCNENYKNICAGGELELTSGLLSIKGGRFFNLQNDSRKNYYISLQIGFSIGYFIELINTME